MLGDVYEIRTFCRSAQGQNSVNVLHYVITAQTGANPRRDQVANAFSTLAAAAIKALLPTTSSYDGLQIRTVKPTPSQLLTSVDGAGPGTRTGDPLPSQVAGLVSTRSFSAPVGVRGRIYLPGGTESDNDSSQKPNATFRADATSYMAAIDSLNVVAGMDTTTLDLCVYSRQLNIGYGPIDVYYVRTNWATQRRRASINRGDLPLN